MAGTQISPRLDTSVRLRAADRGQQVALIVIGVAVLAHLPRERRTWQHAIMLAIGLAAAAGLAQESQARSLARLVAWDQRRNRQGGRG
ncbi:MAG: hypothetical protein ACLPN6_26380 [Streptosporangiaceae bacterium]|jgi:hypothetical protein|nr:hypothetical protein [Actinomycetota bacterium]